MHNWIFLKPDNVYFLRSPQSVLLDCFIWLHCAKSRNIKLYHSHIFTWWYIIPDQFKIDTNVPILNVCAFLSRHMEICRFFYRIFPYLATSPPCKECYKIHSYTPSFWFLTSKTARITMGEIYSKNIQVIQSQLRVCIQWNRLENFKFSRHILSCNWNRHDIAYSDLKRWWIAYQTVHCYLKLSSSKIFLSLSIKNVSSFSIEMRLITLGCLQDCTLTTKM